MQKTAKFIKYEYQKRPIEDMILSSDDFYKKMLSRRTVREISSQDIPVEIIENIIKTAGSAPSGANKQPWFFAVIQSPEMKTKIREICEHHEKINYETKYSEEMKQDLAFIQTDHVKEFLTEAPYLIIAFKVRYEENEEGKSTHYYISESAGIALGMLFTAIHNAGLVTIPYTPMPRAFLREMLDLPHSYSPMVILPVGLPKENASVPMKSTKTLDKIMKIY